MNRRIVLHYAESDPAAMRIKEWRAAHPGADFIDVAAALGLTTDDALAACGIRRGHRKIRDPEWGEPVLEILFVPDGERACWADQCTHGSTDDQLGVATYGESS